VKRAAATWSLVLALLGAPSALAAPGYEADRIATFREPIYVTGVPGSDRLFVAERAGRIRVMRHGRVVKRPFLDIRRQVYIDRPADQRGLLGMALAPDYRRSGLVYVLYTAADDTVQVDEVRRSPANPDRADPASRRHVINIGKARASHHGGQLAFGPDGMLYVATGVSNEPGLAQDLGDLHGKLLRIDPRSTATGPYAVPADNPFVGTDGVRPEIWAYGLRNPWRFSFDRLTGDLLIGDVGDTRFEEVDFVERGAGAGADFGYPVFEGDRQMLDGEPGENYMPPVLSLPHPRYCAVMGGYVVRDRRLRALYGRYLYADMCFSRVYAARVGPGWARGARRLRLRIELPVSFGEDGRARVYVVSQRGGLYRLRPRRGG
jgi:glucose/arabinose dehydrogenase